MRLKFGNTSSETDYFIAIYFLCINMLWETFLSNITKNFTSMQPYTIFYMQLYTRQN